MNFEKDLVKATFFKFATVRLHCIKTIPKKNKILWPIFITIWFICWRFRNCIPTRTLQRTASCFCELQFRIRLFRSIPIHWWSTYCWGIYIREIERITRINGEHASFTQIYWRYKKWRNCMAELPEYVHLKKQQTILLLK